MRLGFQLKAVCISASIFFFLLIGSGGAAPHIFRVDASGDRTSQEVGQDLGAQILEQEPDFPVLVDSLLAGSLEVLVGLYNGYYSLNLDAQGLFDDLMNSKTSGDHIPELVADMQSGSKVDQRYQEEMQGLASQLDLTADDVLGDGALSANEFILYQFLYDALQPVSCSGFGVYGDYSDTGNPIIGRNLDLPYVTTDTLKLQAVTIYQGDSYSFVNIGYMGMAGTITGLRSDGLFGAVIGSSLSGVPFLETGRRSILFDLRYALENLDEIGAQGGGEGIHGYTKDHKYHFSHSLLLADSNKVMIQEHPCGKTVNNEESLPGRLRGWEADLYPTTVSWGGRRNMVAVTSRFVLPPGLPYPCELCPSGCFSGALDVADIAEYSYYSMDHACDYINETCYAYDADQPDDCTLAEPQTNCWEYCNRESDYAGDYWPGTYNEGFYSEDFDRNGYYPIMEEELGFSTAEKWERFVALAKFLPNTQAHPGRAAAVADIAAMMTDQENETDPILAEGTGLVIAVATVESMVIQPVEGRLYLYTPPIYNAQADKPYLEEIGLYNPLKGDINASGLLDLDDAVLCLEALAGYDVQNFENNGVNGELDMETALYILQKKAETRY
ncbi:hypothetical protein Dalk_1494 [Desulfatibacillum aliphaticivorans]|uniref:Dockerin domain-containing protein n=1 Tax=Desulfatibacillum aliphaticivorans TaxID=218208 RepID=B8FA98_DESAL|nr:hypothetical protein Dalk_1494 [Desulfatibacillum aliphaticivorans]